MAELTMKQKIEAKKALANASTAATIATVAKNEPDITLNQAAEKVQESLPVEDRNEPVVTTVAAANGADETTVLQTINLSHEQLYRFALKQAGAPDLLGKNVVLPTKNDFITAIANATFAAKNYKGNNSAPVKERRKLWETIEKQFKLLSESGQIFLGVEQTEVAAATPFSPAEKETTPTNTTAVDTKAPVPAVAKTSDTKAPVAPVVNTTPANAQPTSNGTTAPAAVAPSAPVKEVVDPKDGMPQPGQFVDLSKQTRKEAAANQKQSNQKTITVVKDLAELAPVNNHNLPASSFIPAKGERFMAVWSSNITYHNQHGRPMPAVLQVADKKDKKIKGIGYHPQDAFDAGVYNFDVKTSGGNLRIPNVMEAEGVFIKGLGFNIDFSKPIVWHTAIWMSPAAWEKIQALQELTGSVEFTKVGEIDNTVCIIAIN
jgi:hypothetical protein